ncbi:MAG: 50S ribosomal protein L2 [Methanosarcinales archaeon]|nr:MAG: 50S ribosomal protein L2 [Methanosarcinales archaeon]
MGKRIKSQRRGKGTPTYRAPSHKYKTELKHPKTDVGETVKGKIISIEHDPARTAPIAKVMFEKGNKQYVLIPEGVAVGDTIECGISAQIKPGNTLPLAEIPDGALICNVEIRPGCGGALVRSSGTYAILTAHDARKTMIQLPSGKTKWLDSKCRATVGIVAGGGRTDKPFLKAGKKYHKMKALAGKYPRVRGVAMNIVDHPFGGGGWQHPGRPKTVSKGAPPGRKVGSIGARRTGKRKK